MSWFNFLGGNTNDSDVSVGKLFSFSMKQSAFVREDILTTYTKILTDVVVRTHGINEKYESILWDNCVQDSGGQGLVSMLAEAMTDKKELFIVFSPSVGVLRKADYKEETQIKADYAKSGKSKVGIYISFKNYRRTTMLEIYSNFEYCILSALNKILNTAKSLQVKISGLRSSVALSDASVARAQGKAIATAIGAGDDVMIDKEDDIVSPTPDTSSSEKSIAFLDAKRAFILDLPVSYISGSQTPGIGSTGEADMRAVERGLRQYYFSIIKPVLKALFDSKTQFRSLDFRNITTALETIKAFFLVDDSILSLQSKRKIVTSLFEIDYDEEVKLIEKEGKEREEIIKKMRDQNNDTEDPDLEEDEE